MDTKRSILKAAIILVILTAVISISFKVFASTCTNSEGACVPASTLPAVEVTSPNGGEDWIFGKTAHITWKRNWMPDQANGLVSISIRKSDGMATPLAQNIADAAGYTFTVLPSMFIHGNDYKIVVTSNGYGTNLSDESDNYFSINESTTPLILVLSPNGGESWEAGKIYNIKWYATVYDYVRINVGCEGYSSGAIMNVLSGKTVGGGNYNFTVPANWPAQNQCKVQVSENVEMLTNSAQGVNYDMSDNYFSIVNSASIVCDANNFASSCNGATATVTPNYSPYIDHRNANLAIDSDISSEWMGTWDTSEATVFKVKMANKVSVNSIKIYFDSSVNPPYKPSDPTVSDDAIFLPKELQIEFNTGGNWVRMASDTNIKTKGWRTYSLMGETDEIRFIIPDTWASNKYPIINEVGVFGAKITPTVSPTPKPTPSIKLISPNGGEQWVVGENRKISWTSVNVNKVWIKYVDGSGNAFLITSLDTNPGYYNWIIPSTLTVGSNYKIEVVDPETIALDYSDNYFTIFPRPVPTITPVSVKVVSPNGGEQWQIGRQNLITWITTGDIKQVTISLSKAGQYVKDLVSNIINNGSVLWTPDVSLVTGDDYKISIIKPGSYFPDESDLSDNYFSITNSITAPPVTCFPDNTLIKLPNDPKIYVIVNCQKKWIQTLDEFRKNNYKWSDVKEDSMGVVDQLPNYAGAVNNKEIADGAIIQAVGDSDVYIVKYVGNKAYKRLILSPSVFKSYDHLKWANIIKVDKATLESFTTSNLVKSVKSGKMYSLDADGDIGVRRFIKDIMILQRLGYSSDSIYEINGTDENSYRQGQDLQ